MAIILNDNIKVQAPKPSEFRYFHPDNRPWVSVLEVNTTIPLVERHKGLVVFVVDTKYIYKDDILDTDLVLDNDGGTQDLQSVLLNGATTDIRPDFQDGINLQYITSVDTVFKLPVDETGSPTIATREWVGDNIPTPVLNHNDLTGRDVSDAHPISAITNLQTELDSKLEEVNTNDIVNHAVTNTKLANMNANTLKGRLSGNGTPQDIAMVDLPISTATQTAIDNKQTISPLPITVTSNINTSSDWNGRTLILNNDISTRTITILGNLNCEGFKTNNGTITFVAGSGRTLFLVNADSVLDGLAGSNFTIVSVGTTDYLSINNV